MGTYEDTDNAWLIALTRERRKDTRARREGKIVRYSAQDPDVVMIADPKPPKPRKARKPKHGVVILRLSMDPARWRREQWWNGNRNCGYCACTVVEGDGFPQSHPARSTVDHRLPRSRGGRDVPSNFIMACFTCNNRKGSLDEAEFRALLESERVRATFTASEGGDHGERFEGSRQREARG